MSWRVVVAGTGVCWFVMALALPALAQSSSSQQATFTSNSELVLVPVEVMDHGGQPLRGLKPEDFLLESDGKPQQVALFEEVRRSTQIFLPSTKPQAAPSVSTTFSNLPSDGVPHEVVILAIDRLNTIGYLQKWTRDQLIKYLLAGPLKEATALVAIAPDGLLEFQGPTWDPQSLIQALQRMHVQGDQFRPELTNLQTSYHGTPGEYAAVMANLEQDRQALLMQSLQSIRATLRSFEQIAKAYSAIPGRKTVLWFTTGFPALDLEPDPPPLFGHPGPPFEAPVTSLRHMGKELAPEFQHAFAALNSANVVLYPVDLAAFPEDRLWNVWSGDVCSGYVPYAAFSIFGNSCAPDPSSSWLHRIGEKVVARSTGGEPCDAGNHVEHCIEKAEAESNGYYLLGFYVPQALRKDGWHELAVHVNGDHGPVRSRSGYYLEARGSPPEPQETLALDDAIIAALEYTGIPFSVEPGKAQSGDEVPLKVSVPATSIMAVPGQDKLSFDVVSVPISDHGIPIPGAGRISHVEINGGSLDKALAHGWKLLDKASTPKNAVAVKVVVRDNVTGRVGSVVFPITENSGRPNLTAPKGGAAVIVGDSETKGKNPTRK